MRELPFSIDDSEIIMLHSSIVSFPPNETNSLHQAEVSSIAGKFAFYKDFVKIAHDERKTLYDAMHLQIIIFIYLLFYVCSSVKVIKTVKHFFSSFGKDKRHLRNEAIAEYYQVLFIRTLFTQDNRYDWYIIISREKNK